MTAGRSPGVPLALLAGGGAAALLVVARVYASSPGLQALLWPCPMKALTGVPCPLCGLTRVFVHLAHGEIAAAAVLAPLPFSLVVGALAASAWHLVAAARGARRPDEVLGEQLRRRPVAIGLLVVAAALYAWALARAALVGAP